MKKTPTTKRPESSPSPETAARNKAVDALARYLTVRDHSRQELREKLGRKFDPDAVETALREAERNKWLTPETELAERLALSLAKRHKSQMYIDGQLAKRGLPPVEKASETDSIRRLVERKFGTIVLTDDEKEKAFRFLSYRGFEESAIRQVLNEKRKG